MREQLTKINVWFDIAEIYARQRRKQQSYNQTRINVIGYIDRTKGAILHEMRKQGYEGLLICNVYGHYTKDSKAMDGLKEILHEGRELRNKNSILMTNRKNPDWEGRTIRIPLGGYNGRK